MLENAKEAFIKLDKFDDEFYSEELTEMAHVRRDRKQDFILLGVNPDRNHTGDPYFKFYDRESWQKATKVARISFLSPKLISHNSGRIKPWTQLSKNDIENLHDYLDSPYRQDSRLTVWDALKYSWNYEFGFYMGDIYSYLRGDWDEDHCDHPSYIKSTLECPDYFPIAKR